ncbi:calcium-binding protein [Limimaricola hongkongensis]|uniref:Hemolysin-type calcium-binding region n=1 Tax=Limimaricola hongkongensis DSM 17492 TaxID=1122180 RepID=A0A017H8A2_9RHOB|nr:calcium-binding protein [Limimaricola hongkongensis]EYD70525.1 Hemolysin-type calcium-binding region [Limimaricola hongkongensis DSM 17492]
MPIYENDGFAFIGRGKVAPIHIEVGVSATSTSYRIASTRKDDILPGADIDNMPMPYHFLANGEDMMAHEDPSEEFDDDDGEADVYLGTLRWGAGRETQILDGDDGFVLPLGGDTLPDFVAGQNNTALFEEFFSTVIDEPVRDRVIDEGPLQPGRIKVADLFTDATGGELIQGGDGRNTLRGDGNAELIAGLGGNDTLIGRGGADTVLAGLGNDKVKGGGGGDFLNGHDGNDRIWGQGGDDELRGGAGRDMLRGNRGDDLLEGGGGADRFVFGRRDGDDVIRDFEGRDTLVLNDNLWRGDLSENQVIRRFADVTEEGVLFDFGRKGSILLEDVDGLRGLADDIAFI